MKGKTKKIIYDCPLMGGHMANIRYKKYLNLLKNDGKEIKI